MLTAPGFGWRDGDAHCAWVLVHRWQVIFTSFLLVSVFSSPDDTFAHWGGTVCGCPRFVPHLSSLGPTNPALWGTLCPLVSHPWGASPLGPGCPCTSPGPHSQQGRLPCPRLLMPPPCSHGEAGSPRLWGKPGSPQSQEEASQFPSAASSVTPLHCHISPTGWQL